MGSYSIPTAFGQFLRIFVTKSDETFEISIYLKQIYLKCPPEEFLIFLKYFTHKIWTKKFSVFRVKSKRKNAHLKSKIKS